MKGRYFLEKYFAAANSERGFVSWFDYIFDPKYLTRTYIIKGGSGTGKSTIMKRAAEIANKHGAQCEYYFCSSDPSSLDGVIMKYPDGRRIAMLDGTAPHTTDPKYPGVCDEIVNLGEFWCTEVLGSEREAVINLCEKKGKLYKEVYRELSVCGALAVRLTERAGEMLLRGKLDKAARRLLTKRMKEKKIKSGEGKVRLHGLSAISGMGEVTFTSFDSSEKVYTAVDTADSSPFLFDALIKAADELGLSYDRAPSPLIPEQTEAIRFPELSMSVVTVTERSDAKPINMVRFLDTEMLATLDRANRRSIKRSIKELKASSLYKLAEIRRYHGSLEAIYSRAMDFGQLGQWAERLFTQMGL